MSSTRGERALTLVEVLLVIFLLGVLTSGALKLVAAARNYQRFASERALALNQAQRAIWRVAADLRGAMGAPGDERFRFIAQDRKGRCTLPPVKGRRAKEMDVAVSADRLQFVASGAKGDGAGVVEYALEEDQTGRVRGLVRRIGPLVAEKKDLLSHTIGNRVVEFDLAFLTPGPQGRWVEEWPMAELPKEALPAAVRITLGVLNPPGGGEKILRYTTVVYLPAASSVLDWPHKLPVW